MDKYALSIFKNGRKLLSAAAIAGVTTTRALKMCYHTAIKHHDLMRKLRKAKKSKDTKKVSEVKA